MNTRLKVLDPTGEELTAPYLIRISGWTEDRYFHEVPESQIVEFEDGDVIMHSPASIRHQLTTKFLTFLVGGYVDARNLGVVLNGPAVVRLREGLDYEPDIFYVATVQLRDLKNQYFLGAPTFIIEVVSSSSRNHDLRNKATQYAQHGVHEYWAVDVDAKTIYCYVLGAGQDSYLLSECTGGKLESRSIAGFWMEAEWLWLDPLPSQLDCLNQILA